MRRINLIITIIGLISLMPILFFYYNYHHQQIRSSYNFSRKIDYNIYGMRRINLHFNSYYIAGESSGKLYLGNYTTLSHILRIDTSLNGQDTIRITLSEKNGLKNGLYKIRIDSSQFYLGNGTARSIFNGRLDQWHANKFPILSPYFQEYCPISQQSMVFRYISDVTGNNSLRKVNTRGETIENNRVLERQVDGLFCTAGILAYSNELHQLTYTYFYRNQILLLDTNLNLVQKINTIDPIDSARFKTKKISSNQTTVLTEKPLLVNAISVTWNQLLFIQSKIMGKHEDEVRFKNSCVIDIYDLKNYKYLSSVYLPNQDRKPIRQIIVKSDHIYALSDQYLTDYLIKLPNF